MKRFFTYAYGGAECVAAVDDIEHVEPAGAAVVIYFSTVGRRMTDTFDIDLFRETILEGRLVELDD